MNFNFYLMTIHNIILLNIQLINPNLFHYQYHSMQYDDIAAENFYLIYLIGKVHQLLYALIDLILFLYLQVMNCLSNYFYKSLEDKYFSLNLFSSDFSLL